VHQADELAGCSTRTRPADERQGDVHQEAPGAPAFWLLALVAEMMER